MDDLLGMTTANIGSGSMLLLKDIIPIGAGETKSFIIETGNHKDIGIDILADQNCSVQIYRLPDGETDGEGSGVAAISNNAPTHLVYSQVLSPAIRLVVINTSGSDMSAFALYVRGA